MKKLLPLGMVAGLLMSAYAVSAYPTLAGPTGNGVLPTAEVVPAGAIQLAADFYNTDDIDLSLGNTIPVRALVSLGSSAEIGVGYTFLDIDGAEGHARNVHAKVRLTPQEAAPLAVALGAHFSHVTLSDTGNYYTQDTTTVYLVGTHAFATASETAPVFTGSLGVNWTKANAEFNLLTAEADGFRVFAGITATFANRFSLAAEVQTKDSVLDAKSLYAITARYPFTDTVAGQFGYTNADVTGLSGIDNSNLFAGLNFTFGGRAAD